MRAVLLFFTITLIHSLASGQTINGFKGFDDSKLKPWLPRQNQEYQYLYYFGFSKLQPSLILIIDSDSCYAQIKYGEWVKKDKKRDWIWNYETLKNVRIHGNKFFTDKTDGEFVIYDNTKGLVLYNLWRSVAKKGEYELGFVLASIDCYYYGKFSCASLRLLNEAELMKMTISELEIMRNEIYARYGYIFNLGGEMDTYFKMQGWYKGQYKDVTTFPTELEKRNIRLIQTVEKIKTADNNQELSNLLVTAFIN